MSELTPRERRHERTRQAILDTARALMVEHGVEGMSLREIARRIDYSPAGLYEYFGSKDEIIHAVCVQANDRLNAKLRSISHSLPIKTYLVELGMAYVEFARENAEDFAALFTRMLAPIVEIPSKDTLSDDDSFTVLYHAVERGIEQGKIINDDTYDTLSIAYSLWAIVHGMAVLQTTHLGELQYDFAPIDRRTITTYLDALIQDDA